MCYYRATRNQPCLHTDSSNFIETWYFLIILLFYHRVCIYLIDCKLLYPKTKRKGFIFPPSHGIPPKCKKRLGDVRGAYCTYALVCGLWASYIQNSRVEYEVEFLGNIVVLLEIFHQSGIFLRNSLASSRGKREGFQYYKFITSSLRRTHVGV